MAINLAISYQEDLTNIFIFLDYLTDIIAHIIAFKKNIISDLNLKKISNQPYKQIKRDSVYYYKELRGSDLRLLQSMDLSLFLKRKVS